MGLVSRGKKWKYLISLFWSMTSKTTLTVKKDYFPEAVANLFAVRFFFSELFSFQGYLQMEDEIGMLWVGNLPPK